MKKRENQFKLFVVLVTAMCFLAGCAGPPVQARHEENFYWPNGKGATQIGSDVDITRDGTFEKGFIRECPFDEGRIVTLKRTEEHKYPVFDPACNNFKMQAKKVDIYTHEIIIQGQTVHKWNSDQPNWWAIGISNLAATLLSRGVDAALIYGTGGLSEAAGAATTIVNDVTAKGGAGGKGGKGGQGGKGSAEIGNVEANANATAKTKSNIEFQPKINVENQPKINVGGQKGGKKKSKKKGGDC